MSAKVALINEHAVVLYVDEQFYGLMFEDYPYLRDQRLSHLFNIEQPSPGHLHWPDLDVDLSLEIIKNRESYPVASIKCLHCQKVSYNPNDIENKYCGNCHRWLEEGEYEL